MPPTKDPNKLLAKAMLGQETSLNALANISAAMNKGDAIIKPATASRSSQMSVLSHSKGKRKLINSVTASIE